MEPKRQRELALASVAIVVLAVAVWTTQGGRGQQPVPTAGATPMAANHAQADPGNPLGAVNLEALGANRPEPEGGTRNPFRFRPAPAPPLPTPSPVLNHEQTAPGPTGPAQPAPAPRIPLKFIGEVVDPQKPGGKIAVLSDARGVYYGREGEVIEGRYRIVKIGVESVDLAYLDGRGRQTIRRTGQ